MSQRATSVVLRAAPGLILVLVLIGFAVMSPRFTTLANLQAILIQSSWLVVIALGVNFALLTGGVDLSIGSVMYVAAVTVGLGFADMPAIAALPGAMLIGLLFGLVNGVFVVRFSVPAFLVTLAMAFIGRGIGLFISSTKMVSAGPLVSELGRTSLLLPIPLWIAIGAVSLAWLLLRSVPFGRYVLSVGTDSEGARRAGVPIKSVVVGVYCISGMFAGLGGFISLSQASAAAAGFGEGAEFLAIAAAVLGGTSLFGGRGTLYAPVLGAILITTVQNGLAMINANPYSYPLVTAAIIFLAALLDSLRLRLAARLDREVIAFSNS